MAETGNWTENGQDLSRRSVTYSVAYGCILALGFPLNTVSLWILVRRHSLKSPSAVFMINLALSDLLLVISLPMRVYFYATGIWPLGITACTLNMMLFRNNIRSSAIFITFISVDRLLAVVYPLKSRHLRTTANAWRACALAWVLIVAANIPESIRFKRAMESCNETACFILPPCLNAEQNLQILSIFLFALLAVNVVSTAMVHWALRRHLKDSARINNKMNVMLIFATNVAMFAFFFLPLNVVIIMAKYNVKWKSVLKPTECLCTVNCCLDPLLYYFSLDSFWKKQDTVDGHRTREQLHNVGQDDAHRVQGN